MSSGAAVPGATSGPVETAARTVVRDSPGLAPPPLALYLHFPWCVRKCPYCDFNSHHARGELPEDDYVAALLRDLDYELRDAAETRPLVSIFMGGGTPSLFSGRAIGRVLEGVSARLRLAGNIEITLEANPGTVDAANFRDYRAAGVNRLSIGVQSFDAAQLQKLGRIHDPLQARRAVDTARAAGFDNLNLDLMYGLPAQTAAAATADLDAAFQLIPEHLSWYQLTLEPNTEFARRPPSLPDDDAAWAIQQAGRARLAAAGYAPYEVSAYARGGREARHNRNYWEFGDYLGIGAGAHGKRSRGGDIRRRARLKQPSAYLAAAGTAAALAEDRGISAAELPFEFLLNALRLDAGFAPALFATRTGLPLSTIETQLAAAERRGLLDRSADAIRTTALGRAHLNTLLADFLPE